MRYRNRADGRLLVRCTRTLVLVVVTVPTHRKGTLRRLGQVIGSLLERTGAATGKVSARFE